MGWGGLGMLAVTVAGNLAPVRLLADALARLSSLDPSVALPVRAVHGLYLWAVEGRVPPVPTEWWYWNASRAIPHPPTEAPPITEFPYFAFLFGDLHAHVLALPYTLLVLAAAIHLVADGDRPDRPGERGGAREASILGLLGLATGMLWAINAWDVPTALVVVGLGLGLREVGRRGALDRAAGVAAAWRLLVVLALGRLLVHPYSAHFARAYGSFEPWGGSRTPLHAYLAIHGLFLFGLATYLALSLRGEGGGAAARRWVPGVGLALAAGLAACGLGLPALLVGLATVALPVAIGPGRRPPERLVAGLILLGVGLGAAVELVALRGDAGRMNTVFKVYLQVWALWGVAAVAGPALALRARGPGPRRGRLFRWWAVGGLGLLATALLYPVLATPARLRHRVDPAAGPGLDGEAYIDRAVVRDQGREILLAWDADAIRWLREHVPGSPVVLEASIPPYRWGSRVSVYTGLPTVLGWESHQRQQRAALPGGPVRRRLDAVRRIYTASDPESVLGLLRRYEVRYVYVGPLERLYYGGPGLDKFESARAYFEPVFENPGVRIYRVVGP
jgi:YYY domain-containing protein